MIVDYKRLLPLLISEKMTPAQFMLCYLHWNKEYELMFQYEDPTKESGAWVTIPELEDLIERDYVRWTDPSLSKRKYLPSEFEITDKFRNLIYNKQPEICAEEFWNTYPAMAKINGKRMPLRNLGKEQSKDGFIKTYAHKYGKHKHLHERIMEGLRYAKKHGEVNMNILNFLNSEIYEGFYEESVKEIQNLASKSGKDFKEFLS